MLYELNKTNITSSRVRPIHAIEIWEGNGADELHFIARSIGTNSQWKWEPIHESSSHRPDNNVVCYRVNVQAFIIYNHWDDPDYGILFERLAFNRINKVLIHLDANTAQPGRGQMLISPTIGATPPTDGGTLEEWRLTHRIDGAGKYPKLVIEATGLMSIDTVKGYAERVTLDGDSRHFFTDPA